MAIGRIPEPLAGIQEAILDAKGDLISATAADTPARLAVGSNNQILMADSAQSTGLKWAASATSTLTAKGDLLTATAANTIARLGVGADGTTLVADSSQSTGLKWASASPSFVGCTIKRYDVSTALTANTEYAIAFTTEEYDTDSFHDNTTNNTRITIPTGKGGKYLITAYANNPLGTVGNYQDLLIKKNGSNYTDSGVREGRVWRRYSTGGNQPFQIAQIVNTSAGDYLEIFYQQGNTETVNMFFNAQAVYLGA